MTMNDESLTPEAELASAALDDEVTASERAWIEASPNLVAELSFYAEMRTQLADVSTPPGALDDALAAALAAFDETPSTDLAPVVTLDQRRQRQYRWLGGAAAAAVVLVVAAGVVNNSASNSDSESNAVASSATSVDQKIANAAPTSAPAAAAGGAAATESVEDAAAADPVAPQATTAANGELVITGPAEVSAWVSAPTLDTPEEVLVYTEGEGFATDSASEAPAVATEAPAQGPAETATEPAPETAATAAVTATAYGTSPAQCPSVFSGPSAAVIYQGRQVVVVRDDLGSQVLIIDPVDCTIIATLPAG